MTVGATLSRVLLEGREDKYS